MDHPWSFTVVIAASLLVLPSQGTTGRGICSLAVIPQRNTGAIDELGRASISANGRFVAFASRARLLASDRDLQSDVYVLDLATHTTTLEHVFTEDESLDGVSSHPAISGDGRFVVFDWSGSESTQTREPRPQILLRDRQIGRMRVISVDRNGAPGNDTSHNPVISSDGSVVAFESAATDLVPDPDANGRGRDIYVASVASSVAVSWTRRIIDAAPERFQMEGSRVA